MTSFAKFAGGLALALALLILVAPARESHQAQAAPRGAFDLYIPLLQRTAAATIANGSFEDDMWVDWNSEWPRCRHIDPDGSRTDDRGNQHPSGWVFYSPAQGVALPFPMNQGATTAISGGPGEYVHRCSWDGPDDERLFEPRAIHVGGIITFKAFHPSIRHALQLSQEIEAAPGSILRVRGHILAEVHPTNCDTALPDDHYIASVQLGTAADTRWYSQMKGTYDMPGNVRPWNHFSVQAQVPGNGRLLLKVIVQSNWEGFGCGPDFFLDNFRLEAVLAAADLHEDQEH